MAIDMNAWAQSRGGEAPEEPQSQDPVPMEDAPEDEDAPASKSPEDLENLGMIVQRHLPEIEAQVQMLNPEMLLSVESELPENDADRILELIDTWGDGFTNLASGISESDAIALSQSVADSVVEVEPILVGAWVFRAGQLS